MFLYSFYNKIIYLRVNLLRNMFFLQCHSVNWEQSNAAWKQVLQFYFFSTFYFTLTFKLNYD